MRAKHLAEHCRHFNISVYTLQHLCRYSLIFLAMQFNISILYNLTFVYKQFNTCVYTVLYFCIIHF